jgi:hypothetical protein
MLVNRKSFLASVFVFISGIISGLFGSAPKLNKSLSLPADFPPAARNAVQRLADRMQAEDWRLSRRLTREEAERIAFSAVISHDPQLTINHWIADLGIKETRQCS